MSRILCPYCAQGFDIEIDSTGGGEQQWVTDCEVCCRPIVIRVHFENDELVSLDVLPEQD